MHTANDFTSAVVVHFPLFATKGDNIEGHEIIGYAVASRVTCLINNPSPSIAEEIPESEFQDQYLIMEEE